MANTNMKKVRTSDLELKDRLVSIPVSYTHLTLPTILRV